MFPRPDKLKLHMLRHTTHREFMCETCGRQFKRKDKLKEHIRRMHSADREARTLAHPHREGSAKKFTPRVSWVPTVGHPVYSCGLGGVFCTPNTFSMQKIVIVRK